MVIGISKSPEGKCEHPNMGYGMRERRVIGDCSGAGSLPPVYTEAKPTDVCSDSGNASNIEKHE
jgi:hypothetical protein